MSAHHSLVFPDESLAVGLYRIRSSRSYLVKRGFGHNDRPGKYAWDLAFKNTEENFHDILVFASMTFMGLAHSALGECLGITRRWYFKVKFKTNAKRYDEVVDVYQLASSFSSALLDHVCHAYAAHLRATFDRSFVQLMDECNCINTLLELDRFPGLFSEWWESKVEPMNFGVVRALSQGQHRQATDEFHSWVFENLTPNPAAYKASLRRFAELESATIFGEDQFADFMSFVLVNHWHHKKAFGGGLSNSAVTPSDVMMLQRDGNLLVAELRKRDRLLAILAKLDAQPLST